MRFCPKSKTLVGQYNIPEAKITKFIEEIRKKWGPQFDEDPGFVTTIRKTFTLAKDEAHVTQFYSSHSLQSLLLPDEPKILFEKAVRKIEEKVKEMEEKALKRPTYLAAAKIGREMISRLEEQSILYFEKKSLSAVQLNKNCAVIINHAKPELQKHRGWGELLRDLAFVIANLCTLGLASGINLYLTGEVRFFKVPRTDAMAKVINLQNDLKEVYEEEELLASSTQTTTIGLV